jgi:hypothetical protein
MRSSCISLLLMRMGEWDEIVLDLDIHPREELLYLPHDDEDGRAGLDYVRHGHSSALGAPVFPS